MAKIGFKTRINANGAKMKEVIRVRTRAGLWKRIRKEIKENGLNCDLNHIDVSKITDLSDMFAFSNFNGDISRWNTSKVVDMSWMFTESRFNKAISKWNTGNVINMKKLFSYSMFNKDISKWDVSNVTDMNETFRYSMFNKDISQWNVSNVKNMNRIFCGSDFKKDISKWNISNEMRDECMYDILNKPREIKGCGEHLRTIYLIDDETVCIGCFKGTKKEAIEAIRKKYENKKKRNKYIKKVRDLFKMEKSK